MLRNLLTICAFALVLSPIVSARATTIYVKADSTGDAATIELAVAAAASGDTILIAPGTYELTRGFYVRAALTFIAEVTREAKIVAHVPSRPIGAITMWGSYSVFDGLVFEGFIYDSMGVGGGIYADQNSMATITNCSFINNFDGVDADGYVDINHSVFIGNTRGVRNRDIAWDPGSGELSNNTFIDNVDAVVDPTGSFMLRYNIISGPSELNPQAPIACNDFLNPADIPPGWEDINFSADPLFCSADDLHLQPDSPCALGNMPTGCNDLPPFSYAGAFPPGCSSTPVKTMTWGQLKALMEGKGD